MGRKDSYGGVQRKLGDLFPVTMPLHSCYTLPDQLLVEMPWQA